MELERLKGVTQEHLKELEALTKDSAANALAPLPGEMPAANASALREFAAHLRAGSPFDPQALALALEQLAYKRLPEM